MKAERRRGVGISIIGAFAVLVAATASGCGAGSQRTIPPEETGGKTDAGGRTGGSSGSGTTTGGSTNASGGTSNQSGGSSTGGSQSGGTSTGGSRTGGA